jgi:hypothetical protein
MSPYFFFARLFVFIPSLLQKYVLRLYDVTSLASVVIHYGSGLRIDELFLHWYSITTDCSTLVENQLRLILLLEVYWFFIIQYIPSLTARHYQVLSVIITVLRSLDAVTILVRIYASYLASSLIDFSSIGTY